MSLVCLLYALVALQGFIVILHFTGKGYVISLIFEFTFLSFRVLISFSQSAFKWVLPSRKSLHGELALVTGAASGIGRLISLRLAEKGCRLVLWDVNQEGLDAVGKEIKTAGGEVHSYKCNLRDKTEIHETAARVKEDVGEVSLLVNNAGIVSGKKFMDCTDEEISATFDVNSLAHFWTIREFLPSMLHHKHGHIVSLASIAGKTGLAGAVDYCSSKFAAVGLMEALRQELSSIGSTCIQFTTVCPSLITTGMFEGVKFRFPHLLGFSILTPEYAASKVVDAIEKNQKILMMPRGAYFSTALQHILPVDATDVLLKFLGADVAMNSFIGRQRNTPKM